jgi:hypothetical protein
VALQQNMHNILLRVLELLWGPSGGRETARQMPNWGRLGRVTLRVRGHKRHLTRMRGLSTSNEEDRLQDLAENEQDQQRSEALEPLRCTSGVRKMERGLRVHSLKSCHLLGYKQPLLSRRRFNVLWGTTLTILDSAGL